MRHLLLLTLVLWVCPASSEIIHQEKSLYRNIVVKELGNRRCLAFSIKRQHRNQTCIDLEDDKRVVFPYVRMTFAGLLVNPNPGSLLMIGLGGGTIANVLIDLYPTMEQDLVEVDAAVVRVAREYFNYEEGKNAKVHIIDGRVFAKRARLKGDKYDLIILDAFTGEYIPEHLMTKEFLDDINALLTPDGVIVSNTFAASDLYDHESVTYTSVFGHYFNFKMPGTGNRVIVGSSKALPMRETLVDNAKMLAPRFKPYSINILSFPRHMSLTKDWDTSKRVLTDQYSPANLLRGAN